MRRIVFPSSRPPVLALIFALMATTAAAQVGHDPANTPYSDVRHGVWIVLSGGQFFGNGGDVGVAPHDGPTFGVKMSFMANKTVQLNAGFYYGMLGRLIYDPTQPQGERFTGPVDNDVIWLDGSINFNVMGGKTWHRLAPYIGSGLGMAIVKKIIDLHGGEIEIDSAPGRGTTVRLVIPRQHRGAPVEMV